MKRKYRAVAVLRNTWEKRIPIGEFEAHSRRDAFDKASNSEAAAEAALQCHKTRQLHDIELELVK